MKRRSFLIRVGALVGASVPFAQRLWMSWYQAAIRASQVPNGIPHGIDNWGRPLR